jgi:NAD(P)H dehydrogenase (quinone)
MTRPSRIVVAGATGRIGGATLRALSELGVRATALVRSPDRRGALAAPVADALVADFDDEERLTRALAGTRRLLLCSAHGPQMGAQQLRAVRAAQRAGVEFVVKISASPASIFPGTPAEAAAAHLEVEQALWATSMRTVAVRPNAFAQVLLAQRAAIASGTVRLPLADARVSWVDALDVGRVAAQLLLDPPADDAVLEVTGPSGLTMSEVCEILTEVLHRRVVYEPGTDAQARTGLIANGIDPWYADHMIGVFSLFRQFDAGRTTDVIERLTGRPATLLAEVFRRHRAELTTSPSEPS